MGIDGCTAVLQDLAHEMIALPPPGQQRAWEVKGNAFVERFTISKDGKTLTAIVTVEDSGAFNAPLTLKQTWRKNEAPMAEMVCAENETEHFANQNLDPIPEADIPDF
jgi:hypothetical protein